MKAQQVTTKKRTQPLMYQTRKTKETQVMGSPNTPSKKKNGVLEISSAGAQNSSPLPKENVDVVLALCCPQQTPEKKKTPQKKNKSPALSSNTGTVVPDNPLCEDQNQDAPINKGVEAAPKTIDAHEQLGAGIRKRLTNKVNKRPMERGTNIGANAVENKHPEKKQKKNKSRALSFNTGTVSNVNSKVLENTLCEDQNQDVPINQGVEAAPKTTDAHEQVLAVIRKRRTNKVNKCPMERGTNIEANAVENKHPNKTLLELKPDSPGGKVLASMVNNKGANTPSPRKNKFVNTTLWKSLEAASETEGEQEVCEAQQKRSKKKSKEAASQTVDKQEVCEASGKLWNERSEEAVSQAVDEEVCEAQQKWRKKKSKEAASQTVDEQEVCETQEKFRTEKSKEAVSQTADEEVCEARQKKSKKKSKEAAYQTVDEQEVCEVQQKRKKKKKGREAASQIEDEHEACENPEKRKNKNKEAAAEAEDEQEVCEARQTKDEQEVCEAATQTQHEQEVCETQQKRRRKKKKHADQENNNLLGSMSDITKTKKTELEISEEISEFGLMKNQEEILLDNSCLAVQSRNLPDSAITPLVEANRGETCQRKDKGKDSNPSVSKKKRSKPKAKPMVVESIKRDKSLESISRFDCSSDYLQQENEGDSSKIHRTVQKSEFLVEQTQADSPTDCKQDNKSSLLETDNHVDDSCSHTLKEVSELGNQSSLKKKKSKKTSKAKLIQSTHEEGDLSKVQKTIHDRDIVAELTIGDLPTDYKGNNDLSFLKTNDHVDEIHSPILRATSEQANPSELCKEDCDTSSQDKILAVDNSSSIHPNKKNKHKKDKLKHISHVTVDVETNTTALNESQLEEIVPSTRDDKNDTVMTKDCQIGEIDPSAGSKIDAVMMETEIDNPSERIAFVDDSSADLAKKRSASRKRRRKDKSKNTSHEANTLVGSSTFDTSLDLRDSHAEGSIATSFNGGQKEQIPPIGDGKDGKEHTKDKLKHTSQVTLPDETNTTALYECQMEKIVPSTREDKNDTVMAKDCQIEEMGSSAGSKIDTVMVGTEIDNSSERIAFVDDSSADLTKKKSTSRKRRRKDKSENPSHEANTLVGSSTLDTSLELPDSYAEGSVATSFNAGQKEKIPPIGDGIGQVVLKNECEMDKKPLFDVDHDSKAVVMGPTVGENELGKRSASPEREPIVHAGRKLLILDLNGLLVDIVSDLPKGYKADTRISRKALIKRPFCDDFLKFCFEKFNVAVWSSRTKKNIDSVVDYIFGDMRHKLLFCWDQSHCTETGFNTIENDCKPLVFKELKKLWEKLGHVEGLELPWEKGEFNESNTLLLDDSPYKALLNPPHTAIFPRSYMFRHSRDKSLGPGGDIRKYLESVAAAEHVQKFIEQNPFGQHPITSKNPSWKYYLNIIKANKFCLPT